MAKAPPKPPNPWAVKPKTNKSSPVATSVPASSGPNPWASKPRTTAEPKHKSPSLLGQVGNVVKSLPSGIVHMAGEAVTKTPGAVVDLATGGAARDAISAVSRGKNPIEAIGHNLDKYPLLGQISHSASRTVGRLTDLGSVPFGAQSIGRSQYGQASKEGRIVPTVLEDVGNVGLAAAGASKVASIAGKAGLPGAEAASSAFGKISTLGADVAGGPAKVYTAIPKAINKIAEAATGESIGSRVAGAVSKAAEGEHPWIEQSFPSSTSRGQAYQKIIQTARESTAEVTRHGRLRGEEALKSKATLDEQVAGDLLDTGQAAILAHAPQHWTDEQLAQHAQNAVLSVEDKFAVTPEAARIAADVARGTAPAEQVARIEAYRSPMNRLATEREASALSRGTIKPEQASGHNPMYGGTQTIHEVSEAPARFRQSLTSARSMYDELHAEAAQMADPVSAQLLRDAANDIPVTLKMLEDAGIDPQHLIGGGRDPIVFNPTDKTLPTKRRLSETKMKETALQQRGAVARTQLEVRRAAEVVRNETAAQIEAQIGKTGADFGLASVGNELRRDMAERGFVPLSNRTGEITANTKFVPEALVKNFDKEFNFRLADRAAGWRALGKVNRAWKMTVLPFSPRWQIGNIVGNTLMSTIGAGETPWALARQFKAARRGLHDETIPARLLDADLVGAESRAMRNLGNGEVATAPRTIIGRAANKSYAMNTTVDEMFRSMVYLAKVKKGVAPEQAMQVALKAMGDFTNMSALERGYIREIIPFYAWTRHITKLALTLPIEHPMRVAWTLHLADMYGDDQSQLPGFLQGSVKFGDTYVPAASLNPFGDVVSRSPLTPSGLMGMVTPAIKLPVEMATGIDFSHGGNQATRPAGVGNRNARGNLTAGPILQPSAVGNMLINQVPVARGLRDFVEGPAGRYSGTGQRVLNDNGKPVYPGGSRIAALGRTLLPWPRTVKPEDLDK